MAYWLAWIKSAVCYPAGRFATNPRFFINISLTSFRRSTMTQLTLLGDQVVRITLDTSKSGIAALTCHYHDIRYTVYKPLVLLVSVINSTRLRPWSTFLAGTTRSELLMTALHATLTCLSYSRLGTKHRTSMLLLGRTFLGGLGSWDAVCALNLARPSIILSKFLMRYTSPGSILL